MSGEKFNVRMLREQRAELKRARRAEYGADVENVRINGALDFVTLRHYHHMALLNEYPKASRRFYKVMLEVLPELLELAARANAKETPHE